MRYVVTISLSCLLALAQRNPEPAAPPEVPELVHVKDCAEAMRVWREGRPDPKNPRKKIPQPLALTKYLPRVVPLEGKPNQYQFTVVPIATVVYEFQWPNMSAADEAAVLRHLPALRAHERRHWEIAVEFVAKQSPVTIYPTDKFTVDDLLKQQSGELDKQQKTYDILTLNGEGQSVLGVEWENLVFNCWPIHVLHQDYSIRVEAWSGRESLMESAKYEATDLEPFGPLFAGIPGAEGRRTRPVIERTRIGANGKAQHETAEGTPTAVGENFWPIHRVELPGAGARAGIDIKFTSGAGEFIVDGIVGLHTETAGGGISKRSTAELGLTLGIGSPTAARATVSGCTVFDKEVFARLGTDFVDGEDDCSFSLTKTGTDDFVATFDIHASTESAYPPVYSTLPLPSAMSRVFRIRIVDAQE